MKTIIIGEHHADPSARLFVKLNIAFLISQGCSFFGFEHGDKTDLATEIQWLEEDLDCAKGCMGWMFYVFFNHEYQKIQSNRELLALFKAIAKSKIQYQGLDADIGNRWAPDAPTQVLLHRFAVLAKSHDFDAIIKYRDGIIVDNLLKHQGIMGINILGLMHLRGVQQLLIERLGEQAVRDNYEFVVIRGKTLTDESLKPFVQECPIPLLVLNSSHPEHQLKELLCKSSDSSHLKMD